MDHHSPPPVAADQPALAGRRALLVVASYAVGAALWIGLSDWLLARVVSDPFLAAALGAMKGWAFVAVTSLLLFVLLQRSLRSADSRPPPAVRGRLGLLLAAGLAAGLVLAAGVAAVLHTAERQKSEVVAHLKTVAAFKSAQIANWLGQRRRDGDLLRSAPVFGDDLRRWRQDGDAASRARLLSQLEDYRRILGYRAVWLLDAGGRPLLTAGIADQLAAPELRSAARRAVAQGKVLLADFYRVETARGEHLYLDVVAPLGAASGEAGLSVVLRVAPDDFLYPYLLSWPLASKTAETLLFRQDGGDMLFLSPLRQRPEAALRLRLPLGELQAVGGDARLGDLVQGVDYRGEAVLGVTQAIAGTDWFLLAKVDRGELYADLRNNAAWIMLADALALFAIAFAAAFLLQRRELSLSRSQRAADSERFHALRLLETIADSSTDAIYAKDAAGRYLIFNRQAGIATGKPEAEVLGRDDTALFPPEEAAEVMATDRQLMASGAVQTLEETVSTPRGERIFLSTKGALLDEGGAAVGVFGISRDISQRKAEEAELRRNEQRWIMALDSAGHGVWDWDLASGNIYFSRGWKTLLGYREDEIGDHPEEWSSRVHPDDLAACLKHFERHLRGETASYRCEHRQRLKDGSYAWFLDCGQVVARDAHGKPLRVIGTRTDIGRYKQAVPEAAAGAP